MVCTLTLVSCAAMGTRVRVHTPELAKSVRRVLLAPAVVDNGIRSECPVGGVVATAALREAIASRRLFEPVNADSAVANPAPTDSELITVAPGLGAEAVLRCSVVGQLAEITRGEHRGLTIPMKPGTLSIGADTVWVTTVNRVGMIAELELIDVASGRPVVTASFGTQFGKSYWNRPKPEIEIADAVRGAVKALERACRR
jgi:hypothetical protein